MENLDELENELTHVVVSEADGEELKAILNEQTSGEITPRQIDTIMRTMPKAIATWLQRSTPLEDGTLRGEAFGGLIIHVARKEASTGHGIAEGVEIPAHYNVYTKLHHHALDVLTATFGLECKNG